MTLDSGLDEVVDDGESVTRFLFSSSSYNSKGVKASAFLPEPADKETSVFRFGAANSIDEMWNIGSSNVPPGRKLHGAAVVKAESVRKANLEIKSAEPPPKHAVIIKWPWDESDPRCEKSDQLALALLLAAASDLYRYVSAQ